MSSCEDLKNEDGDGSDLDEEPRCDQGQAAVLTVEAVVISIKGKVVKVEEPTEGERHHMMN